MRLNREGRVVRRDRGATGVERDRQTDRQTAYNSRPLVTNPPAIESVPITEILNLHGDSKEVECFIISSDKCQGDAPKCSASTGT